MNSQRTTQIHAVGFIPPPGDKAKPITVITMDSIRASFDATRLQQSLIPAKRTMRSNPSSGCSGTTTGREASVVERRTETGDVPRRSWQQPGWPNGVQETDCGPWAAATLLVPARLGLRQWPADCLVSRPSPA